MLKQRDKIFQNLYGQDQWNLEGARQRGVWSNTIKLIAKGSSYIVEEIKKSGLPYYGPFYDHDKIQDSESTMNILKYDIQR